MRKLTSSILVIVFGLFLVSSVNLKANGPLVEAIDGASIRVAEGEKLQGLRFYAKLNGDADEHGFYLVFGESTVQALKTAIGEEFVEEQVFLNEKEVFRVTVGGVTQENEFSVVLTGIPGPGYLQKVSVFPFAVVDGVEEIVDSVTRSVGEVALKAANAGEDVGDVIDELETNFKRLGMNAFGELELTGNMLETNHFKLREEFIKDWNAKFGTTWNSLVPGTFFSSAAAGIDGTQGANRDLSDGNLYKFFNDPIYKDKWNFVLEIAKSQSLGLIHPERQALAIQGNGTVPENETQNYLMYFGSHLIYSIANFFNQAHDSGGYNPINFTGRSIYNNILPLINEIVINFNEYDFYKQGAEFEFEAAPNKNGYTFSHYSFGENNYDEEDTYIVGVANVLFVLVYNVNNYDVEFYLNETKLNDLSITYTVEDALNLVPFSEEGYAFEGWYDNPELSGSPVTSIPKGSTGNKVFYAKATYSPYVKVDVTFNLNGGNITSSEMIDLRASTYIEATRYSTAGDNPGNRITVGTSRGGLYWYVMGFKPTGVTGVYQLVGKGAGYTNEEATLYVSYHDGCNSPYKATIQAKYTSIAVGDLVVIEWLPPAVTADTSIDMYFMAANMHTANIEMELQTPINMIVPAREGYEFLGWCAEEDLSDDPILEFPGFESGDGVESITYYAKWEIIDFKVTYDFGEYGYISELTKAQIFDEFMTDFATIFGRGKGTADNFYTWSYWTVEKEITAILNDGEYGVKYNWIKQYILAVAEEISYAGLAQLQANHRGSWRINIHAFFNESIHEHSAAGLTSMDFTDEFEMNNGFWKYSPYGRTTVDFINEGPLFDGSTISSWNDNYEFEGWYSDEELTIKVTELPESIEGNITIYAKWIEK